MQIAAVALLLVPFGLSAGYLSAQTTAGASAAMSNSGVAAEAEPASSDSHSPSRYSSRGDSVERLRSWKPVSSGKKASGFLIAPSGPPPAAANRKKFEENAGEDAGKVLLRSIPDGASIFVDHILVGNTPLLLFLAPGRYEVEMRGARQQSGHQVVTVMPRQTETAVIDMNQRYPSSVSLHW